IATGETHSVREFVEKAFGVLDTKIEWKGKGIDEVGIDVKSGKTVVRVDPKYYRPTEVDILVGDASKAAKKLGWEPKVKFEELVKIMTEADWNLINTQK
ncbi:MAG: GDP-mannose 4,6-dehydratase, partial [Chitinispirillaceae bacterium]|nr:GDP-mannose 4,6-dehydratase [Chitinispirillaceae bacterium]